MTFFLHLKLYQFQQPHLWNVGIPTLTVLFQEKPSIQQQNNDFCSTNLWYLHFPAIKTCVQVISSNDGWNIWKNHLKPSQTEVFQSKNVFFQWKSLRFVSPSATTFSGKSRELWQAGGRSKSPHPCGWVAVLAEVAIGWQNWWWWLLYLYTTQRLSFSPNAGN